jgi:hypothetical protein
MARGDLLFTKAVACALAKRIEGLLVVVGKLFSAFREPSLREKVLWFSEIAGNVGRCPLRDTHHSLDFVIS